MLNQQLLTAAEAAPEAAWSRILTIGDSEALTLQFVFDDYFRHMVEHLRHMGIAVDDFAAVAAC